MYADTGFTSVPMDTMNFRRNSMDMNTDNDNDNVVDDGSDEVEVKVKGQVDTNAITKYANNINLLQVPPYGSPPARPSPRVDVASISDTKSGHALRGIYGGKGDKLHLGGFTEIDPEGISPKLWRDMMEYFGVKTLLDVGCGRGLSTSWFFMQGVDVQCVEGSHDAITRNVLPELITQKMMDEGDVTKGSPEVQAEISKRLVEHDFSLGPYWPEDTVDAVWSVELLEHISRNFQPNYLTAFKKAALLFVTHSNWGGWHHTEVHDDAWWRARMEMHGFVYSEEYTKRVRKLGHEEAKENHKLPVDDRSRVYNPIHIKSRMLVFINPLVASKPQHAHILSEGGCYLSAEDPRVHCGEEKNPRARKVNTPIPERFKNIPYKEEQHTAWEEMIHSKCTLVKKEDKEENKD